MSSLSSEFDINFCTQICDNIDGMNILSDDTINNDDGSIDDLDNDSDFSIHEDIDDEQNDGEITNKREMKKADQDLYAKSLFIT